MRPLTKSHFYVMLVLYFLDGSTVRRAKWSQDFHEPTVVRNSQPKRVMRKNVR